MAASDRFAIDRHAFEPPYAQLATHLRQGVAMGRYRVGERLPSEAELSDAYGVSRMTARRATGELITQGLAERRQGKGIFVRSMGLSQAVFNLDGLQALLDEEDASVKVLEATPEPANAEVAMELELRRGAKTVYLRQILSHNESPVLYLVGHAVPQAAAAELEQGVSPFAGLLANHAASPFFAGILELRVHVLREEEARLLDQPVGAPAWAIEHTLYDAEDRPLMWGFLIIPDQHLRFPTHVGGMDPSREGRR